MTKHWVHLCLMLVLLMGSEAMAATSQKVLSVNVDRGVSVILKQPAASVFIANPDIADVQVMSSTSIMIFGKRTGETTFVASDSDGRALEQCTVNVTQDLTDLRQALNMAIPDNHIHASPLPNGIILTGEARDPSTVSDAYKIAMRYVSAGGDIINRIRVAGSNQIQIRVRFAEVQRNIDNTLGFDWNNLGSIGGITFGLATGAAGMGTGSNLLSTRPSNTDFSATNDLLGFSHTGGRYNVNGIIDALEREGLVTILAEPNLTAMSGETANFLAGGEFPILIPQGNGSVSVEYKSYGISLAFTPTLINDQRISLHVRPEVSQLSTEGAITVGSTSISGLVTRRAETTVEVASGQSFAIAGLLDNDQSNTVDKFPGLGDLPVIGPLFRSNSFQTGQTELVIVITPYLVRPSNQQLALPTDGLAPPGESDRLLDMRYSSSDPNARAQSGDPVGVYAKPTVSSAPASPVQTSPGAPVSNFPSGLLNQNGTQTESMQAGTDGLSAVPPFNSSTEVTKPPPSFHLEKGPVDVTHFSPEKAAPVGAGGFILE